MFKYIILSVLFSTLACSVITSCNHSTSNSSNTIESIKPKLDLGGAKGFWISKKSDILYKVSNDKIERCEIVLEVNKIFNVTNIKFDTIKPLYDLVGVYVYEISTSKNKDGMTLMYDSNIDEFVMDEIIINSENYYMLHSSKRASIETINTMIKTGCKFD